MFSLAVSAKVAGTPTFTAGLVAGAFHYGIRRRTPPRRRREAWAAPPDSPWRSRSRDPRRGPGARGPKARRGAPEGRPPRGPGPRTEGRGCAWPSRGGRPSAEARSWPCTSAHALRTRPHAASSSTVPDGLGDRNGKSLADVQMRRGGAPPKVRRSRNAIGSSRAANARRESGSTTTAVSASQRGQRGEARLVGHELLQALGRGTPRRDRCRR